jgi:RimJ/RimL family protein N-acetyltransferase
VAAGEVAASSPSVVLRDVAEPDLAVFFAQQYDDDAARLAAVEPRGREAFFDHWARIRRDERATAARTVVVDGAIAGYVVSFPHDGRVEIGYWLGREYWGRGIASRALRTFLDLIEERPLHAAVAPHNPASMRVLEKCGFTRCGEHDGMVQFELRG